MTVGEGAQRRPLGGLVAFEREVVDALVATDDPGIRRAVTEHADAALAAMPEVIRAGLLGQSLALGAWAGVRRRRGGASTPAELVAWLAGHPVGLVRQWLRALRSLVLFAEHELADPGPPGALPDPSGPPAVDRPAPPRRRTPRTPGPQSDGPAPVGPAGDPPPPAPGGGP